MAAFSVSLEGDDHGRLPAVFRFLLLPIFLFSGTFFPVDRLPDWLEPMAWATPLWHGVELCRDLTTGNVDALLAVVHVVYLYAVRGCRRRRRDQAPSEGVAEVTDYALTGRVAPWFTFGADRSLRLVYRNLKAARRYWLVMVSGFFEPLFYLVGLGGGVRRRPPQTRRPPSIASATTRSSTRLDVGCPSTGTGTPTSVGRRPLLQAGTQERQTTPRRRQKKDPRVLRGSLGPLGKLLSAAAVGPSA